MKIRAQELPQNILDIEPIMSRLSMIRSRDHLALSPSHWFLSGNLNRASEARLEPARAFANFTHQRQIRQPNADEVCRTAIDSQSSKSY